MAWIVVPVGGALGSEARHGVNLIVARLLGSASPYTTATDQHDRVVRHWTNRRGDCGSIVCT